VVAPLIPKVLLAESKLPVVRLLSTAEITDRALLLLKNNLKFTSYLNQSFESTFPPVGSTITIRKPSRYSLK
jgi:hypothetical protein